MSDETSFCKRAMRDTEWAIFTEIRQTRDEHARECGCDFHIMF